MKSFTRKEKKTDKNKVAVKGEELTNVGAQKNSLLQFVGRLRASTMKYVIVLCYVVFCLTLLFLIDLNCLQFILP
jgi:hypothetical protein